MTISHADTGNTEGTTIAAKRHGHDWLELRVFAPRDPEERVFVFDGSENVGKAAADVAAAFGYAEGNHTFETRTDDVLDRSHTLLVAGVRTGDLLELIDVGGGV
ncbi:hypothetical protein Mycch_5997 (plasmid) [Mycolicibacterium chubuense NBB4]|uniref:Uncharacterized protein n=1 Tax=Mycolicibacterium chubuense (strain NBB4) TaxID=710421 RepID=I4BTJ2_MYCCN|nr:hypothetical protein [Mycolicibacterium chubuense]AFM20599.1 hypothetical protein Mycch_5997 [Mycolicibacterium chubuense NBB4]